MSRPRHEAVLQEARGKRVARTEWGGNMVWIGFDDGTILQIEADAVGFMRAPCTLISWAPPAPAGQQESEVG